MMVRRYIRQNRRSGLLALVIGFSAAACGGAVVAQSTPGGGPVGTSPGEPLLTTTSTAASASTDAESGFTLTPPGVTAALSAQSALDAVWPVEGAPGHPTTASAEFAQITWPAFGYTARAVWIFTYYPATCIPMHGPGGGCRVLNYHTIADATTGAFVASYDESAGASGGS